MKGAFKTVRILGADFFNDDLALALQIAHTQGGLFLAPSGPGISELGQNPHYDAALQHADVNLIDSGYLVLLWRKRTGEQLHRHSGLKFIKALIEAPAFRENQKQLWVMPSADHSEATRAHLNQQGLPLDASHFYAAPDYRETPAHDLTLLDHIRSQRPAYIIICIAGGKQEVLGHWLLRELDYRPAIICTGAAIAFLSGQQAYIPGWADRIYIGWFLRILSAPGTYIPRYWHARKLKVILDRWGTDAPGPSSQL